MTAADRSSQSFAALCALRDCVNYRGKDQEKEREIKDELCSRLFEKKDVKFCFKALILMSKCV